MLTLLSLAWLTPASAADHDLDRWLTLDPVTVPVPAFSGEDRDAKALLDSFRMPLQEPWPARGDSHSILGQDRSFKLASRLDYVKPSSGEQAISYAVQTLTVDQFAKATFTVKAGSPTRLIVDGQTVLTADGPAKKGEDATGKVDLTPGPHRVVLITAANDDVKRWRTSVSVELPDAVDLTLSTTPDRTLMLDDILRAPSAGSLSVSADGAWMAVDITDARSGTTDTRRERRLYRAPAKAAKAGDLSAYTTLSTDLRGMTWAPTGHRYAATLSMGDHTQVVVGTPEGAAKVVATLAEAGGLTWVPTADGSPATQLLYTVAVEHEDDGDGIQRVRSTADRWTGQRDYAHLWMLDTTTGLQRQLTAADHPVSLLDVAPDGTAVLVSEETYDTAVRPFTSTTISELDLASLTTREVLTGGFVGGASYTPDGQHLLVTGSPMAFDKAGATTADGVLPNDYDTQLFLTDRDGVLQHPLTKAFKPTVRGAELLADGTLIVRAEDEDRVRLFRAPLADVGQGEGLTRIDLPGDVVHSFAVAHNAKAPVLLARTSSANSPMQVVVKTAGASANVPLPTDDRFAQLSLDTVEDFNVELDNGDTLVGRVHLPPNYDASKRYPAIVYYYGGTAPSTRSFGGRYPHAWWASQGYVVYVPQPSGATGFGQEWSSRHVADWGDRSAKDVIAGTESFLTAYPAVDADKVGCIGASFGGFLTMKLITQTDLFGAAISHAGISLIPSYWGEGWWGHLYSAASAAEAYPWSNPEVFLERSPLLMADKITTPLLLLHGAADTNVPVGESDQMYVALKVLGKEVEYLRIDGEDHWILDPDKRMVWSQSIVAWFDRQLKGQPAWWDALVGED